MKKKKKKLCFLTFRSVLGDAISRFFAKFQKRQKVSDQDL